MATTAATEIIATSRIGTEAMEPEDTGMGDGMALGSPGRALAPIIDIQYKVYSIASRFHDIGIPSR